MRKLAIYKPNSDQTKGSAFQFEVGEKKTGKSIAIFVEAAKQNKPKPAPGSSNAVFDWTPEGKSTIMLGINELGDVLAFMDGFNSKAPGVKFVHKSKRGDPPVDVTAGFELMPPAPDNQYANWALRISNNSKAVYGYITPGELILLRELIKLAIANHFSTDDPRTNGN